MQQYGLFNGFDSHHGRFPRGTSEGSNSRARGNKLVVTPRGIKSVKYNLF